MWISLLPRLCHFVWFSIFTLHFFPVFVHSSIICLFLSVFLSDCLLIKWTDRQKETQTDEKRTNCHLLFYTCLLPEMANKDDEVNLLCVAYLVLFIFVQHTGRKNNETKRTEEKTSLNLIKYKIPCNVPTISYCILTWNSSISDNDLNIRNRWICLNALKFIDFYAVCRYIDSCNVFCTSVKFSYISFSSACLFVSLLLSTLLVKKDVKIRTKAA